MEENNNKPRIGWARRTARDLLKEAGITTPPILIRDILKHIKKEKDLSVHPWAFGEDTDGIQITQGESATIGYNQSQHSHRQRFTVAHEIGHFLLCHTTNDSAFDLDSKKPEEVEANQFAAELLMPLEMFKKDFKAGMTSADDLGKKYNVSKESAWWRMYNTKLI